MDGSTKLQDGQRNITFETFSLEMNSTVSVVSAILSFSDHILLGTGV